MIGSIAIELRTRDAHSDGNDNEEGTRKKHWRNNGRTNEESTERDLSEIYRREIDREIEGRMGRRLVTTHNSPVTDSTIAV